jgi:predicted transcriptional regulator
MHALTVRLPEGLYRTAKGLAEKEGISLNRHIQEAIAEKSRQATERQLREAYEILADDAEGSDVEGLLAAQAEALSHGG